MSKEEKAAAKVAKEPKKAAAKVEPVANEGKTVTTKSGIIVGDPMDLRPKKLPLVVEVPEDASSAQKEYAKVLNSYAYTNPEKWKKKKDVLIKRLESLAGVELAEVGDRSLSIKGSKRSFVFIKDPEGKGEIFAQPEIPSLEE